MEHTNGLPERSQLQQRCFSEQSPDGVVHFQVVNFGRQLFVWLSVGSEQLGQLCMATQTRMVRAYIRAVASALLVHSSQPDVEA